MCSKDTNETAQVFIYEKSLAEYVVFDIRNDIEVYIGKKPIEIKNRLSSGIIESSLWNALVNNNLSPALVVELEAIYAWTLDFFLKFKKEITLQYCLKKNMLKESSLE